MNFATLLLGHPWRAAFTCLLLIVLCHSPRLWLLTEEVPGTFEWDRARSYLKQCESPFRTDIEPAMRWRFVPQIFVHYTGNSRVLALSLPWIGALALLAYLNTLARRRGWDELTAAAATLTLGASAPVLVSTGWLGVNDAWVLLGLCYVACGRRWPGLIAACLLCPFIDERFVFGLPAALVLRHSASVMPDAPWPALRTMALGGLAALLPFLLVRGAGLALRADTATDSAFLRESIKMSTVWLWWTPLATWMALRFALVPLAERTVEMWRAQRMLLGLLLGATLVPLALGFTLAADTMRTAGILLPVCVWAAAHPQSRLTPQVWRWLAVASLLVPAAHITYTKIAPINSFVIELWRVLR